jgi:hypothetical protein
MGAAAAKVDRMNLPKTARNEEIYRLAKDGVPFAELGKRFGITSTRVRQVFNKHARWERGLPAGLTREESEAWIAKMNSRVRV